MRPGTTSLLSENLPTELAEDPRDLQRDMLQGEMENQITFRLVHNLILARMNDEAEIEHRKALSVRNPALLKCYLHAMNNRNTFD